MSKNSIKYCLLVLSLNVTALVFSQQNIAINRTGASAYTGAILDLSNGNTSGSVGFLPSYVSLGASATAFGLTGTSSNLSGELVYNKSTNQEGAGLYYWYYNSTTPANSTWTFIGANTIIAASNDLSLSTNMVQLGGNLIQNTTIDQNNGTAWNMIFDLGTGSAASTGNNFTIQNYTSPYIYFAPSAIAANGPLVGIGNNSPGALLNVSTSANLLAGNAIILTAQQGAASNAGGAVTIASGAGGSGGSGGAVSISAGSSSTAAGSNVTVQAGAGNGSTNSGGDIVIEPGAAASTGTNGGVAFNNTGAAPNAHAAVDIESTTQGFLPPKLTTTQISNMATPIPAGLHVYNTTTGCLEMYNSIVWQNIKCACTVTETGSPTVVSSGNTTMVTFTSSGSFTTSCNLANVQILEVGGGGGGGRNGGGGGGGGGVVYQVVMLTPGTYNVTVGGGGTPSYLLTPQEGTNGGNSQFGTLTAAVGGGLGGDRDNFQTGATGGSGGGGGGSISPTTLPGTGGTGTAGQGNNGGNGQTSGGDLACDASGGGGGGAGGAGSASASNTGGNGGNGVQYFGTYYGGGGGGGVTCHNNGATTGGTGGLGGGGNGGNGSTDATGGTANTGGGGGGINAGINGTAGYGGSGVVIVIYTQ